MPRVATFALLLALLPGCRVQEYVAAKDEVPVYASVRCDRVIDRLPLGHHERVLDEEAAPGVAKVECNGATGFVRASDLRLLKYVHPELDEGLDRDETVGRAVREVTVAHAGTDWPGDVRDAIRDGRVLDGMTREQVELAWGWPRTIEPLSHPPGGERWIYRRRGYETFDGSMAVRRRFRPAQGGSSWGYESPSSYYRLPVVEERVVEFNDRKVARSYVRRYYDVDGADDS